jgi:outer membrane lipoprotein-sorting protein
MIFGHLKSRSRSIAFSLLALGFFTPTWAAWDVASLMQQLAQHPSGKALFTETKTLAVLDQPVVSTGTMLYSPPDRLEKHTLKPVPESLVIRGNDLTVVRDGVTRQLRLPQYPEVLAFVEALRGTLVGSRTLLEQHYSLSLSGSQRDWRLVLTPLDDRMKRWVKQIQVKGSDKGVNMVETLQADGDKSVISITPDAP